MPIVDTHCHVSLAWYEPVESLIQQMDRNGVDHAVLVQMGGQYDNEYQFECVARYPHRLASIVLVDADSAGAPAKLARLAARGARGVRLSAETRSPGADPLAIWRAAQELGLSVSCRGSGAAFAAPEFADLAEALPTLPIVIEHLAGFRATLGELPPPPLLHKVFALARYPNVYMKFHGLGEICERKLPVSDPFPFARQGAAILARAYAAFGPERLMWGSDYPPVSGREGYTNALRLPMAEFAATPAAERALMFGGAAAKLYGFA